jgi:predicted RNA-binding protein (virulence factor B family)
MVEIGKYNSLRVVKILSFGAYLSEDGSDTEILLPTKYIPKGTQVEDLLNVFVYKDSEDRIIATTLTPYATVGEFAYLTVVDKNEFGAFIDLGIAKDIFVPKREQSRSLKLGNEYVFYIYLDPKTERLVGTNKWLNHIQRQNIELQKDEQVSLLITAETNLGYNVIINNLYIGLVYKNEVFESVKVGDIKIGYVKNIRDDGKIDVRLTKKGFEQVLEGKDIILQKLKQADGKLPHNDKTDAEVIYQEFGLSKKAFKKAIGNLYKEKIISIEPNGIKLI